MATMGEMIGNIAHQWKQPLIVISLSNGILNLNKELGNFFNPNKKDQIFNIKDAFYKTFKLIDSQFKYNNIEIKKNIESITLSTNENELLQTLINILKNEKEELVKKDKKLIFIDTIKKDNQLIIKIKDNSNGIPEDIIYKIFEPYFTTKENEGGTGIGLYMSKQIIENMGGNISISNVEYAYENVKCTGAEFKIVLILN